MDIKNNTVNKILYIDSFNYGAAHEMFNASLLLMCSEISNVVNCKCLKSNFISISSILNDIPKNIIYSSVYSFNGFGRFSVLVRYILGVFTTLFFLFLSSKDDLIIIPFNNVFALRFINYFNFFLKRNIVIFCHNEMEVLVSDVNTKGVLSKLLSRFCRSFFLDGSLSVNKFIFYSVIGDKILSNLNGIIPENILKQFVSIDHPYIFNNIHTKRVVDKSETLKIATIGTISESKGAHYLVKLAECVNNDKLPIEISHIGRVNFPFESIVKNNIRTYNSNNQFITRRKFESLVENMDYLLYFYDSNNYKITASGAIMDAIAQGIPIISLRNDYFNYMFDKFGSFGFLVDSIDEMIELLNNILLNNNKYSFDMEELQLKFNPHSISYQLKNVVDLFEKKS